MRPVVLLFVASCLTTFADHHVHDTHAAAMGAGRLAWSLEGKEVQASIRVVDGDTISLVLEDGSVQTVEQTQLGERDKTQVQHWQMVNAAPEGFGKPDRVIRLETLQGQMRYSEEELSVAPGAKVQIVLQNVDDMHHNLLLCTPDSANGMEVAQEAWKLGGDGFNKQWIPEHPKILFASRMADPHSTIHGYFTAPKEEGNYPYVCTLPGHAAFMKGVLKVASTPPTDFSELTYMLYHGDFNRLPDFEKLTPVATDHVASGWIDLSVSKRREHFAVVYDGILTAPMAGTYRFSLASDDGSRLEIDGEVILDLDGVHGTKRERKKVELTEGPHKVRVSYFEKSGEEALSLGWSGPGFKERSLSVPLKRRNRNRPMQGIPLASQNGEAKIYRNFIEGAGNRAIGVGFPGGINAAFDADQMRLAMVWLGGFIDAARHWNGRGQGHQAPLGYGVVHGPPGAPFARLESKEASWPEPEERSAGYRFKGYDLIGKTRFPRFRYHFGEIEISDQLKPDGDVLKNDAFLVRAFELKASEAPDDLYFRAAVAKDIQAVDEARFLLDSSVMVQLSSSAAIPPLLRKQGDQMELLLPVVFENGQAILHQQISYLLSNAE